MSEAKKRIQAQSKLLLHPLRLRLVRCLGQQELSPLQISQRLPDVAQATLYRHLKKLEAGGVIEVSQTEAKRGTLEKTYRLVQADISARDLAEAGPEEWLNLFESFCASLRTDLSAYLSSEQAHPLQDGVGMRQVQLYLSPEELTQFSQALNEVVQAYLNKSPAPERRGFNLATLLIPERPSE